MSLSAESALRYSVSDNDRAFLYGDGLFETLLVLQGKALWPALHLDRLMLGAQRLEIEVCRASVLRAIEKAVDDAGEEDAGKDAGEQPGPNWRQSALVLRVTLSRGAGSRGYRPTSGSGSRITTSLSALDHNPLQPLPPAIVATADITIAEQPLLAGIKHCNRLEQVMAAAEAGERGVDDVLMCTADGSYQCSSNANIFAIRDGDLITPPCTRSGVAGTRRRLIRERLAPQLGLAVLEQHQRAEDLYAADALFLSNSVMGLRAVSRLDGKTFAQSQVLLDLQAAYVREARECCAS